MKTLTQICKSVKEKVGEIKETLEGVIEISNPGVMNCTTSAYPSWHKNKQDDLKLKREGASWKIYNEDVGGAPLVRYDEKPHEHGDSHVQYGEKTFTGRLGNEAADLMAHILVNNPNISFPGTPNPGFQNIGLPNESEEDKNKRIAAGILANMKKNGVI